MAEYSGHPRGYCGTAGSTQPPFSFTFKSANTGPGAAKQKRNGCSVAYRLMWFNCAACYILISYADSQLKVGYCSTFFSGQSHMNTGGYGQYYYQTTLLSCCMSLHVYSYMIASCSGLSNYFLRCSGTCNMHCIILRISVVNTTRTK